jgi:beta-lactamase regulating signal transducer with metallopeptidase domain
LFTITFRSITILPFLRDILRFPIGGIFPIYKLLIVIWIFGTIVKAFVAFKDYQSYRQLVRFCPVYTKTDVSCIIENICGKYKRKIKFKILYLPTITIPAIIGIIRPKIIMPATEFSEKELYFILSHEITHYYKKDLHVRFLCELLCIIYWWNPFMFILKNMISKVLEIDTDCKMTEKYSEVDKHAYIECLLKVAKSKSSYPTKINLSFVDIAQAPLYQRIKCILETDWSKKSVSKFLILILSIALVAISFTTIVEPYKYEEEGETKTFNSFSDDTYLVEKDGYYEIYQNGVYIAKMTTLVEPFNKFKIYKSRGD